MPHNVLTSIEVFTDAFRSFWNRCTSRIDPNKKRIREHLDNCLMLVMALNPYIGYEKAAKISLTASPKDLTLHDAALKLGFLIGGQFDSWVRPDEMTHLPRGAR
jgi:fumarate hydratase class II